jgi:hypothetical protein
VIVQEDIDADDGHNGHAATMVAVLAVLFFR